MRTRALVPLTALALAAGCAVGACTSPAAPAATTASSAPAPGLPTSPGTTPTLSQAGVTATSSPARRQAAPDGDVDGDGVRDNLALTGSGLLRVTYSRGESDTVTLAPANPGFTDLRVLGASDADRDGHAEVFVLVGQGASFYVSTVLRYVDGHLHPMTHDGAQAALASGGSTGAIQTWACRPASFPTAAIVTGYGVRSGDVANVYSVTETYYQFEGTHLVQIRAATSTPRPLDQIQFPADTVTGAGGCGSAALPSS